MTKMEEKRRMQSSETGTMTHLCLLESHIMSIGLRVAFVVVELVPVAAVVQVDVVVTTCNRNFLLFCTSP